MTAGTAEEATLIGDALVTEHLAACINLLDGMTSIYRWQGKVQRETETVLIAKTTKARVTALSERVKELHSYDCPCIVTLPIDDGNADFLTWISNQVKLN
jgi:periplasmic divalent cation tolerance protein